MLSVHRRLGVLFLISAGFVSTFSAWTSAAVITLNPTRGLTIFGANSGARDATKLSVYTDGDGQGFGTDQRRSLVQFDLSGVPTDAAITSATLTLIHDSAINPTGQPTGTTSQVWALSKPWTSSANWDFAAAGDPWDASGGDATGPFATNNTTIPVDSGPVSVSYSVTSLVSQWTAGTLPNDGMLLLGSYGNGLEFYATGKNAPVLSINYTPLPEPGSIALVVITGALAFRRRRQSH